MAIKTFRYLGACGGYDDDVAAMQLHEAPAARQVAAVTQLLAEIDQEGPPCASARLGDLSPAIQAATRLVCFHVAFRPKADRL